MHLTEDELYRSSTQFRHWSFTPATLAAIRHATNAAAAERVRPHLPQDAALLTPEDELRLVTIFCSRCVALGQFLNEQPGHGFPFKVVATAVQYVRRFYLFNSLMIYDPKKIMPSCLFLATKTEGWHTKASDFAQKLPRTTADDILAPEYLISQALRFTFDVRHPHRGLDGGHMELMAMAKGAAPLLPGASATPQQVQDAMLQLPGPDGSAPPAEPSVTALLNREGRSWDAARRTLKSVALTTDAYFFYTPAQIWLAALVMADEPLARFYLDVKLPNDLLQAAEHKDKLLATVHACATMLHEGAAQEPDDEVRRLAKKRDACADPEKADLVSLHAASKRGGAVDGVVDDGVAKRRKLERQQSQREADAFWGPEIGKPESAA
ncbi:uncharacterized protein K452DRAFT_238056 [Aplosporella prunicola CBS 121167]|uniref:RNA polymerase II holoenzyme cyclin-like subunit n=1 Tax=Aplosporella prunicola CBS 121167 TaxID=1176127 RepID=A0A6A6AXX8_9PEZI|nr:uncharacterized protein K452DRAFT_238056 [Aplosporella prunicola CBS 121167]KAF2136108.1 hypothetical protein K452DRAFT_238056 [Aplosporella prunicola CBS 121167]